MKNQYWTKSKVNGGRGKKHVSQFKISRLFGYPVKLAKAEKVNGKV